MKKALISFVVIVLLFSFGSTWLVLAARGLSACQVKVVDKYWQPGNDYIRQFAKNEIDRAEFERLDEQYEKELKNCRVKTAKNYFLPRSVVDRIWETQMQIVEDMTAPVEDLRTPPSSP